MTQIKDPIILDNNLYQDRKLFIWPDEGYWLIANNNFWEDYLAYIRQDHNNDHEYEIIRHELEIRGIVSTHKNDKDCIEENPLFFTPTKLIVSMTDKCNLRCPYCYANSEPKKTVFLNIESAKKAINFVSAFNNIQENPYSAKVSFVGGEPLLHKDFFDLVQYVYSRGLLPSLTTNGTIDLTENQIKVLIDTKAEVNLSIDGYDEKSHAFTRDSSFHSVLQFGQQLIKYGIPVYVTSVIHSNNYKYLEHIIEFFYGQKFSGINLNAINKMGRGCNYSGSVSKKELYLELFEICIKKPYLKEFLNPSSFYFFLFRLSKSLTQKDCGLSNKAFYLNQNGKMYICGALKAVTDEISYKSTSEDGLIKANNTCDQIINTLCVEKISKCTDCLFKYFCAGECRGESNNIFNNMLEANPDCSNIKNLYKEMMFKLSDYPDFFY